MLGDVLKVLITHIIDSYTYTAHTNINKNANEKSVAPLHQILKIIISAYHNEAYCKLNEKDAIHIDIKCKIVLQNQ